MDAVIERAIEGAGTSEAEWHASGVLDDIRRASFDQLLDGAHRLVVASPHPDDEVLGCGGLIAHAARVGVPVVIVAVSDGEHCYPGHREWTPERLRRVRANELHDALRALGVDASRVVRLSMDDGAIGEARDALGVILADVLRPTDVLLSPWSCDGHPDHEATLAACVAATVDVGCALLQYPIWAWHWMRPTHAKWQSPQLRRLELDPALQRAKAAAIACFASQTGVGIPAITAPILPPHVVARFTRGFEVFMR